VIWYTTDETQRYHNPVPSNQAIKIERANGNNKREIGASERHEEKDRKVRTRPKNKQQTFLATPSTCSCPVLLYVDQNDDGGRGYGYKKNAQNYNVNCTLEDCERVAV
jgi:hypothetical protein